MELFNKIKKPWFVLAPMVANSELAWRILARRYGASFCYTEMVHCEMFLRSKRNPTKNQWFTTNENDRPLVIQVCGNNPETMLEACKILQSECDAIDINFGCPQEIARKGKYGSWLQEDKKLIQEIVKKLSINLNVPVFCKIRILESIEETVEYAKMIEEAGCSLLTVHGRTREQRGIKTGLANWEYIKKVKESLKIPVLSNGNILYNEDLNKCLDYTGCDGVMVAETHLYNPLIFSKLEKTVVEVYKEYLEICDTFKDSAKSKHIKSHSFKLFYNLIKSNGDLIPLLNDCHTIKDYKEFANKIEEINFTIEELRMFPYIRQTK